MKGIGILPLESLNHWAPSRLHHLDAARPSRCPPSRAGARRHPNSPRCIQRRMGGRVFFFVLGGAVLDVGWGGKMLFGIGMFFFCFFGGYFKRRGDGFFYQQMFLVCCVAWESCGFSCLVLS